ncbi:MAG: four helix bundle protein [Dysgonamonadaceae bacterium]|jgi:four helix bundle protein|nr:four helix bundle protein [Dysgonamonadaceae bacterium]
MKKSILQEKSYSFAIRIVRLSQYLRNKQNEFVLSKQILRSGTSIGVLIREAEYAQSNADFINKFSIALKEANETDYWANLLKDTDYLESRLFESIVADSNELISMLVSTIKTLKSKKTLNS